MAGFRRDSHICNTFIPDQRKLLVCMYIAIYPIPGLYIQLNVHWFTFRCNKHAQDFDLRLKSLIMTGHNKCSLYS